MFLLCKCKNTLIKAKSRVGNKSKHRTNSADPGGAQGASGVISEDFRTDNLSQEFLISILDFVLMDDSWVISCSKFLKTDPSQIQNIRVSLEGGQQVNWT